MKIKEDKNGAYNDNDNDFDLSPLSYSERGETEIGRIILPKIEIDSTSTIMMAAKHVSMCYCVTVLL